MTELLYLLAAVLFMVGLKMLSSVQTARRGNLLSLLGMAIAVGATLLTHRPGDWTLILVGAGLGAAVGAVSAITVQMTAMPQMVALYNGFGGGASALVGVLELLRGDPTVGTVPAVAGVLSILVGWVTLTGSLVAFGKLQGLIQGRPVLFAGQHLLNLVLLLASLGLGGLLVWNGHSLEPFLALNAIALLLGVLLVIPIGGADMPVVISLLNSYSGVAGALAGFVLFNNVLIITGSLVGASGLILTNIMCKAMNRSLANVLFGGFGAVTQTAPGQAGSAIGAVNEGTVDDAVTVLENARSVIMVPGYGMAVSQAQHALRELGDLLEARAAAVKYAIHPVAGRMPGHMNVLLAEANVPYDQLVEMEVINPEFPRTDVAVVVGANDVVNPAAKNTPASPIYGMPILNVDQARAVIVLKRSMNPGFAGIENDLFTLPNTMMVFGDAKDTLMKMSAALKAAAALA
jgi:NAD(P) transhydrogenase subunit beta